jgi:CheY-like chemotaxis protein
VLDDVLEGGGAVTEYCGRNLIVNLPQEPVYLNADPVRLGQIIGNLVNNACKYTDPDGTVALTVQREGDSALIRVADTGIGIAPEILPHIFEMFTQVDHSLERTRGGLGLGLAIVKRLVELHEGTVQVASAGLGQGTEFIVRLPLAPADLPAAAAPETPEIAKAGSALKIVVADDNIDSAESMMMLLQLDGHDVRSAFDGRDAIEVAEKFRPDAILLDIGMPRMNGYDTAREIRKTEWGRETILVALTGWGLEKNKRDALAAGFNHHLVKPVDIDEIRRLFSSIAAASAKHLATHS